MSTVFRILGELAVDGVVLGGRRRRGLLALLLARSGTHTSLDRICDELWDGNPTVGAPGTVRTYVSQFRKLDAPMTIEADATGYGVTVDRALLDATRFEDLVRHARLHSGEEALELIEEALDLWRGAALAEFRGSTWADAIAHPLEAARRRAVADRLELLGDLGRHDDALAGLDAAIAAEPLDERLAALRALQLYRAGQVAEGLRAIGAVRRALAEELGVDPSPELVDLERRMLERDRTLGTPAADAPTAARRDPPGPAGAELPTGTVTFLFTDIVGSTALLREVGDEVYADLLARHRDLIADAVGNAGGRIFGTEGDAVFAVFSDADAACAAAGALVTSLRVEPWPAGHEVAVRTGLHTGRALLVADDYAGSAVHLAARVAASAHAHQIVATDPTVALVPALEWRDLGSHRLKDVERPQRIHQLVVAGLPASFPPLPTVRNVPTNLPDTHDRFVGRDPDVASVRQLLAAGPLTTLVGPGGVGKTRLAVETARSCLGEHPGGVHFVALAGVSSDEGVEPTVRRVMSLPDRSDLDLGAAVATATSGEVTLVLLDNCEHVLGGATAAARSVLDGCPRARLLCTTREPLRLRGERIRWVEPLPTSIDDRPGPADELFLARAESATGRPVPDAELPLVQELTRGLDGLPLAIELAAARTRGLALVDVVRRLDDRFRLLRAGPQDLDDRHQTLGSVIAWSHELLTPPDRALLNRVAVFGGSFSLGVAEEICTDELLDTDTVMDGMARLVEKSLVRLEVGPAGSRYRLLETIRRFGLERLGETGNRARFEERLVEWVLQLVDRLERDMRTERQDAAIRAATQERAVARTAFDLVLAAGRWHEALRIVASVPLDVPIERIRLIDALVDRVGSEHPETRGRAHLAAANLSVEMGAMDAGVRHSREAGRIYRELDDLPNTAWAGFLESFATWGTGDRVGSRRLIATALSTFEELGDRIGMANASWMLASLTEDLDEAELIGAEAERRCRLVDAPTAIAHCLEARSLIRVRRGETSQVGDWLGESLQAFTDLRHEGCTAHVLEAIAAAVADEATPGLVAELLGASDRLREISGHTHRPWELQGHAAAMETLEDELAEDELCEAIERGREHTFDSATDAARRLLDSLP